MYDLILMASAAFQSAFAWTGSLGASTISFIRFLRPPVGRRSSAAGRTLIDGARAVRGVQAVLRCLGGALARWEACRRLGGGWRLVGVHGHGGGVDPLRSARRGLIKI